MKNYDFKEVESERTFTHVCAYEKNCGEVTFLLRPCTIYVEDDFDEVLGTVELSHEEYLGYHSVSNFNTELPIPIEELDLTWMKKKDVISFYGENQEYPYIKKIRVNIDNLWNSSLPMKENGFRDVGLVICNNGSKLNLYKQISIFKNFVTKHSKIITRSVKFEGFSTLTTMLLSNYAQRLGLDLEDKNAMKLRLFQ